MILQVFLSLLLYLYPIRESAACSSSSSSSLSLPAACLQSRPRRLPGSAAGRRTTSQPPELPKNWYRATVNIRRASTRPIFRLSSD